MCQVQQFVVSVGNQQSATPVLFEQEWPKWQEMYVQNASMCLAAPSALLGSWRANVFTSIIFHLSWNTPDEPCDCHIFFITLATVHVQTRFNMELSKQA